jgi:hypothetical protein
VPQTMAAVVGAIAGGGVCFAVYYFARKYMASMGRSAAQNEYLAGFGEEHLADPFLTWYTVAADKSIQTTSYTRGEFLTLALKACRVLRDAKVGPGDCHTHFFSCNTVGDLAFRMAAALGGTTPVTINWQADTPDRVVYKAQITQSKLVLFDDETPTDVLSLMSAELPGLTTFNPMHHTNSTSMVRVPAPTPPLRASPAPALARGENAVTARARCVCAPLSFSFADGLGAA